MIPVGQAGATGVVKDLSLPNLPANAWTDARNMRFLDGSVGPFAGESSIYAGNPVEPIHVLPVTLNDVRYWMYAGAAKLYIVRDVMGVTTHTDLTRLSGDYTAVPNDWTSTVLGGVPVFNNPNDAPQTWLLDVANRAIDLPAWPSTYRCKSMRSFSNCLVALGIKKGSDEFPYMVKWSHPADPGSLPITWDIADATKLAGEYDLSEGYDRIIDGLPLRGSLIIYKESSVWRMDPVGGNDVFKFTKVLGQSGALNRNCIVELDGQHLVLTGSDVILHDGQSSASILDKQARRHLFATMNTLELWRCFVFKNPYLNEVFICYPADVESGSCNRAMVWNWVDRTVTFRDLPSIHHAAPGPITSSLSDSWDIDTESWSDDLTAWNQMQFSPDRDRALMAGPGGLYLLDSTPKFSGQPIPTLLERVGISAGDPNTIKTCRGVRPIISGPDGETVMISIGSSKDPFGNVTWQDPMPFVIGETVACDGFATGRYLAVKFEDGTALTWKLDGYQMDVVGKGKW